ncbi:hypothetical protein N0V93_006006 [Gnomoniopsis smithogilvyi]|uniref:Methyltransferase n=1 Tax=Gnomoniopsis smithogilvyi TaxID=1191159 RepID=A0A9W9CU41_9PEZI|nr:hypothetical protein N0V93_006006 [Gnomoniopsis smithogilvyi]
MTQVQPEDVECSLRYLKPLDIYKHIRPYGIGYKADEKFPTNNLVFQDGPKETIRDVRAFPPGHFWLDRQGFSVLKHDFKADQAEESSIEKPGGYLDELRETIHEELARQGLKAEEIKILNWVHRTARETDSFNHPITGNHIKGLAPDVYIHNDCDFAGAEKRIRATFGDKTDEILASKRVLIMGLWKPINHPVEDCNLTICDGTTVDHDICIHGDFYIHPEYTAHTLFPGPSEKQQWYYVSNQDVDELLFFKLHDTDETCKARFTPHGAFWRKDPAECKVPRESIEVRAIIVLDKRV